LSLESDMVPLSPFWVCTCSVCFWRTYWWRPRYFSSWVWG